MMQQGVVEEERKQLKVNYGLNTSNSPSTLEVEENQVYGSSFGCLAHKSWFEFHAYISNELSKPFCDIMFGAVWLTECRFCLPALFQKPYRLPH